MNNKRQMKAHNELRDATLINSRTYFDYLERFRKIATAMFEWENLPDSMDSRYLELCLYYTGSASILYDEKFGFVNARALSNGSINMYGVPTQLQCVSYQYRADRRTYTGLNPENDSLTDEAILVMNTWDRTPTANTLELFAMRLTEAERTCDINIKQQKFPRLILTTDAQQFTLRNLIQKVDNNELNIFGDKNILSPDQIKSLDTSAPYVADKLMDYKKEIWNEFLTFLGINNLDYKRERLVTDETDSKNELINMNLQSFLAPRKRACKQFNEKFGKKLGKEIDVKVRSDLENIIKTMDSITSDLNFDKLEDKMIKQNRVNIKKKGSNE